MKNLISNFPPLFAAVEQPEAWVWVVGVIAGALGGVLLFTLTCGAVAKYKAEAAYLIFCIAVGVIVALALVATQGE
jgi:hypothetical protein